MQTLKCVLTGKKVFNLGRMDDARNDSRRFDGVSTEIGVVHRDAIRAFLDIGNRLSKIIYNREINAEGIKDERILLRMALSSKLCKGKSITSKQAHNLG